MRKFRSNVAATVVFLSIQSFVSSPIFAGICASKIAAPAYLLGSSRQGINNATIPGLVTELRKIKLNNLLETPKWAKVAANNTDKKSVATVIKDYNRALETAKLEKTGPITQLFLEALQKIQGRAERGYADAIKKLDTFTNNNRFDEAQRISLNEWIQLGGESPLPENLSGYDEKLTTLKKQLVESRVEYIATSTYHMTALNDYAVSIGHLLKFKLLPTKVRDSIVSHQLDIAGRWLTFSGVKFKPAAPVLYGSYYAMEILPDSETRLGRLATRIMRHDRNVKMYYAPAELLDSQNAAMHDGGNIFVSTKVLVNLGAHDSDTWHELRHGYIHGLPARGLETIYSGLIARIKESRKLPAALGVYRERYGIDELSTFGYSLRSSIPELKNLESLSPEAQIRFVTNLTRDAAIARGIAIGTQEVMREGLNELAKYRREGTANLTPSFLKLGESTRPDEIVGETFIGHEKHPTDGFIGFEIVEESEERLPYVIARLCSDGMVISIPMVGADILMSAREFIPDRNDLNPTDEDDIHFFRLVDAFTQRLKERLILAELLSAEFNSVHETLEHLKRAPADLESRRATLVKLGNFKLPPISPHVP